MGSVWFHELGHSVGWLLAAQELAVPLPTEAGPLWALRGEPGPVPYLSPWLLYSVGQLLVISGSGPAAHAVLAIAAAASLRWTRLKENATVVAMAGGIGFGGLVSFLFIFAALPVQTDDLAVVGRALGGNGDANGVLLRSVFLVCLAWPAWEWWRNLPLARRRSKVPLALGLSVMGVVGLFLLAAANRAVLSLIA